MKTFLRYLFMFLGVIAILDWFLIPFLMGLSPMADWWHLL